MSPVVRGVGWVVGADVGASGMYLVGFLLIPLGLLLDFLLSLLPSLRKNESLSVPEKNVSSLYVGYSPSVQKKTHVMTLRTQGSLAVV